MTNLTQESKCYSAAMKMLMRREHSKLELFQKLQVKGFEIDIINAAISKLVKQNYQSDDRFSEEFIKMRFNQGKGPVKIASELKMRGINSFDLSIFDWFQLAKEIRQRKFGDLNPNQSFQRKGVLYTGKVVKNLNRESISQIN